MKYLITVLVILLSSMAFAQDLANVGAQWTSPGDDSLTGTAYVYDVRYCFDDSMELINDWDNCTWVAGAPSPEIAGTSQSFSFIVPDVPSSSIIYVAIKTADETFADSTVATNWSGISNIKSFTPGDLIPPAAIIDFELTVTFTLRIR